MNFLAFLDGMWILATRPMITVPKFFAEFSPSEKELPVYFQEALPSRISSIHARKPVASSFASTSLLAVITMVGFFDFLKVSNSALSRSFLLTMCKLAPGSTTNSLSSGFLVDAAGNTHSSEGEQNAAFFPFL